MAQFYINQFKMRLDEGADDYELNEIIETASELIDDNNEYKRFYEVVTQMYKEALK